jgi:penicillin G amidase
MKKAPLLFCLVAFAVSCYVQAADFDAEARAALSQTSGTIKLTGLIKPVRVFRDPWGVAHIYAENQHDLFFAQGFVAAEDRLFQMELWKRAGQGRLAEVLGPSAIARDRYARLLRYRGDMKAEYQSYAPDTYEILAAFTDGINAFIRTSEHLPIEFKLAGFSPEPWKPEDCLSRMAAFAMTGNASGELENTVALNALGPKAWLLLSHPSPRVQPDPVPGVDYSDVTPQWLAGLVGGDARIEFPADHNGAGSNNWTISGKLTSTGKPILANDPHRVMALPSLRYMVHLVAPGWDVIGSGEPALPGVAIGHNRSIAWGLTIFPIDQQDLYFEEINPDDPNQYRSGDRWEQFVTEETTISVKGAAPQKLILKFTQHGPVMAEDPAHHRVIALRWIGSEPGTAGYLASLSLDRVSDWNGFLKAMARWKLPPENMVYADRQGNIGEQSAGLVPIRSWTGLFPVPDDPRHQWTGFIPLEELPRSFNPANGFIATANNNVLPVDFKYKAGYEWSTFRVERIRQVLADAAAHSRKLSLEDMQRLQTDVLSLPAKILVASLPNDSNDPWVKMLRAWDDRLTADSAAAALYEVWERNVLTAFGKKVTGDSRLLDDQIVDVEALVAYLQTAADSAETRQMLLSTLATAAAELEKLQGSDPAKWAWGPLHAITFRHSLDQLPEMKHALDLGPVPRPGDGYTINATGAFRSGFAQSSGASYREILDLSDWDNSLAVNAPGQSAQPASPHYSDLLPLWSEGKYFPLLYSREKIEAGSPEQLVLTP